MLATRTLHLGPLQLKFHPIVALFVVVLIITFLRLGLWQLDRAAEKNATVAETLSHQSDIPQAIEGLFDGTINSQDQDLATVNLLLRGQFINDKNIWVANQMYEENIGYEVLSPFRLQSNGKLVLVSRGWVNARAFDQPAQFVNPIQGIVEVTGLLQTKPFTHEQKNTHKDPGWPKRIVHVDMQDINTLLEESVFPYVVRLNQGSPGLLIKHWKDVTVRVDKHYSYALQWFAMAIAVVLVALYLSSNIGNLFKTTDRETFDTQNDKDSHEPN